LLPNLSDAPVERAVRRMVSAMNNCPPPRCLCFGGGRESVSMLHLLKYSLPPSSVSVLIADVTMPERDVQGQVLRRDGVLLGCGVLVREMGFTVRCFPPSRRAWQDLGAFPLPAEMEWQGKFYRKGEIAHITTNWSDVTRGFNTCLVGYRYGDVGDRDFIASVIREHAVSESGLHVVFPLVDWTETDLDEYLGLASLRVPVYENAGSVECVVP